MTRGTLTALASAVILVPLSVAIGMSTAQGSSTEDVMPPLTFPTWGPEDNERNEKTQTLTDGDTMPAITFPGWTAEDNERDEKTETLADAGTMPALTFPTWGPEDNERTPTEAPE